MVPSPSRAGVVWAYVMVLMLGSQVHRSCGGIRDSMIRAAEDVQGGKPPQDEWEAQDEREGAGDQYLVSGEGDAHEDNTLPPPEMLERHFYNHWSGYIRDAVKRERNYDVLRNSLPETGVYVSEVGMTVTREYYLALQGHRQVVVITYGGVPNYMEENEAEGGNVADEATALFQEAVQLSQSGGEVASIPLLKEAARINQERDEVDKQLFYATNFLITANCIASVDTKPEYVDDAIHHIHGAIWAMPTSHEAWGNAALLAIDQAKVDEEGRFPKATIYSIWDYVLTSLILIPDVKVVIIARDFAARAGLIYHAHYLTKLMVEMDLNESIESGKALSVAMNLMFDGQLRMANDLLSTCLRAAPNHNIRVALVMARSGMLDFDNLEKDKMFFKEALDLDVAPPVSPAYTLHMHLLSIEDNNRLRELTLRQYEEEGNMTLPSFNSGEEEMIQVAFLLSGDLGLEARSLYDLMNMLRSGQSDMTKGIKSVDNRLSWTTVFLSNSTAFQSFKAVSSVLVADGTVKATAELMNSHKFMIAVSIEGHSRITLAALTYRPCPVQVVMHGDQHSTRSDMIDYFIGDGVATPPEILGLFTEKLVYMPSSIQLSAFMTNSVFFPDDKYVAQPRNSLAEADGDRFRYCVISHMSSVSPETMDIFVRILQRVPSAVLWIVFNGPRADFRTNIYKEAKSRGMDFPQRRFRFLVSIHDDFPMFCDLVLDTMELSLHSIAVSAIAHGVPVLTTASRLWTPARVAASTLVAGGIAELVSTSIDEYEDVAVMLAHNARLPGSKVSHLQRKVRTLRRRSGLFNQAAWAGFFARQLTVMWEVYLQGEKPRHVVMAPPVRMSKTRKNRTRWSQSLSGRASDSDINTADEILDKLTRMDPGAGGMGDGLGPIVDEEAYHEWNSNTLDDGW